MPKWRTRSNLSAAIFPFNQSWMGRSVIVGQYDQNFDRSVVSTADTDKDRGIPQVFYMHNVVPTGQGFMSISHDEQLAAAGAFTFDKMMTLRNTSEDRFLYVPSIFGGTLQNLVYDPSLTPPAYTQTPITPGGGNSTPLVTTAYINNRTYVWIAKVGMYEYDKVTHQLVSVPTPALTVGDILGICAANGYLIAWSLTRVFWSSITDPTDFTPSLVTGAGAGNVNDTRGPIQFCMSISGGFIVYTERNAVGASYTGNAYYPFVFKEIVNSGGVLSIEDVTADSSNAQHYAITTSGLQQLDRLTAVGVFPELTDFLISKILEDFDEAAFTFTETQLANPVIHKLTLCANRYLICSYGSAVTAPLLSYALAYDLVLKRWGKFKIDHVDCFDYFAPLLSTTPPQDSVKGSVGFLTSDGRVTTVNFSSANPNANGAFVLGKFQFFRNALIQLNAFTWENKNVDAAFECRVLPSMDGKNFDTPVVPYLMSSAGYLRDYNCRVPAVNVSLAAVGGFTFCSNEIEFTKLGDR